MKTTSILTLTICLIFLSLASAQTKKSRRLTNTRSRTGLKSPFRQDGSREDVSGGDTNSAPQHKDVFGAPKESPYTPPSNHGNSHVKPPTTSRPVKRVQKTTAATTTSKKVVESIKSNVNSNNNNKNDRLRKTATPDRDSPYNPPIQRQWRQGSSERISNQASSPSRNFRTAAKAPEVNRQQAAKKEPSQEKPGPSKRRDMQGIPAISSIQIKPRQPSAPVNSVIKSKARRRPVASAFQDTRTHRDIHEAGPGEKVWTRYTQRPRVSDTRSKAESAKARCGSQRYSPRSRMCCQGQLVRRQGVKPSCCGAIGYDSAYNKCCNGAVSFRSGDNPDC